MPLVDHHHLFEGANGIDPEPMDFNHIINTKSHFEYSLKEEVRSRDLKRLDRRAAI